MCAYTFNLFVLCCDDEVMVGVIASHHPTPYLKRLGDGGGEVMAKCGDGSETLTSMHHLGAPPPLILLLHLHPQHHLQLLHLPPAHLHLLLWSALITHTCKVLGDR